MEAFHTALTAQAATSALDTLEDELVRDLFIFKMRSPALQDSLTFETLPPDEVLKRALKFEQSKQTTQAFQKTNMTTASTISQFGSRIKIKQEPKLAVRNRGQANKRYKRDRFKTRQSKGRKTSKYNNDTEKKPCSRSRKPFTESILKIVQQGGKCKNCNMSNHFARMFRSQQVNGITETTESSEEECNLRRKFDSCDEFEVMPI